MDRRDKKPAIHDLNSMGGLRRPILISVCGGAAFGIVFFGLYVAYTMHKSRQPTTKPWNIGAVTAEFDGIQGRSTPLQHIVFNYSIVNNTNSDYWFDSLGPQTTVMVRIKSKDAHGETLAKYPMLRLESPRLIPAKARVRAEIYFLEKFSSEELRNLLGMGVNPFNIYKYSDLVSGAELPHDLPGFVVSCWPDLNGFVAYDGQTHYQMNFPAAW